MLTRFVLLPLLFFVLVSTATAQVAGVPVRVTLSGTPSPAGGTYAAFFGPFVNNAGQVAFHASLVGAPAGVGNFAGLPGSIATVVLPGTPAPGGGNYSSISEILHLNNSGQVVFTSSITGGSSANGIFGGVPGFITAFVLDNTPSPAGGLYSGAFLDVAMNNTGQVAFYSSLVGTSAPSGLFAGAPGSVATVALEGTPAPAGGNYVLTSPPASPQALNDVGQVAFRSNLTGGSSNVGIFAGTPGSLVAVALDGTPAPAGGNYAILSSTVPVLNNSGQVAFSTALTGGSANSGIFAGVPGSLVAVALEGDPAPAGGNYSSFSHPRRLNNAGQVAFRADLTGGTSAMGIFAGVPGSLVAVALEGDPAPAGAGALYASFFDPLLNNAGVVAFRANLTGPGVTAANDLALYAGLPDSILLVVRTGDVIDVDPGPGTDFRTIAPNGIGPDFSLSDSGHLLYHLEFTDGSTGLFISVVPVPEPGTMCLLGLTAVGAGLAARWRAKRDPLPQDLEL